MASFANLFLSRSKYSCRNRSLQFLCRLYAKAISPSEQALSGNRISERSLSKRQALIVSMLTEYLPSDSSFFMALSSWSISSSRGPRDWFSCNCERTASHSFRIAGLLNWYRFKGFVRLAIPGNGGARKPPYRSVSKSSRYMNASYLVGLEMTSVHALNLRYPQTPA